MVICTAGPSSTTRRFVKSLSHDPTRSTSSVKLVPNSKGRARVSNPVYLRSGAKKRFSACSICPMAGRQLGPRLWTRADSRAKAGSAVAIARGLAPPSNGCESTRQVRKGSLTAEKRRKSGARKRSAARAGSHPTICAPSAIVRAPCRWAPHRISGAPACYRDPQHVVGRAATCTSRVVSMTSGAAS